MIVFKKFFFGLFFIYPTKIKESKRKGFNFPQLNEEKAPAAPAVTDARQSWDRCHSLMDLILDRHSHVWYLVCFFFFFFCSRRFLFLSLCLHLSCSLVSFIFHPHTISCFLFHHLFNFYMSHSWYVCSSGFYHHHCEAVDIWMTR